MLLLLCVFTLCMCGSAFIYVQQRLTEELPVSPLRIDPLIAAFRCKHESMLWCCNKQGTKALN